MNTLPVSQRLNGIIRAMIIEAEDLRRFAHDVDDESVRINIEYDAKAMDEYARMVGDIQRQAANEEEAREVKA